MVYPGYVAQCSVHFFHLANDLLFKDRQDCLVLPYFFKYHTTVKLVTHFLKVVSRGRKLETVRKASSSKGMPALEPQEFLPPCNAGLSQPVSWDLGCCLLGSGHTWGRTGTTERAELTVC